ncbi:MULTISPECIES: FliG C-terminal domain-containing protein [Nitratireductor]|uniref:FliG C-terminal domain-containing protein n=1 Tax=Nitratireductor TaxID=245876 RepID=UPI000D0D5B3E|nr:MULTISPECIES: FliG C-terminal domain-containing protein [Nitratireductor]PSM18848.1 flagellar motor switch protein FliG [Nitratireductor sp. StC3]
MDFDAHTSTTSQGITAESLTRAQKAAAILVAMGKPAAGRLLKFFSHEELKSLIEAARMLKTIPQGELEKIIAEFEDEFAEGAGLMDSAATMDKILSESLSPEEVSAIMNHGAETGGEVPVAVWPQVEKLEPERVGAFLAGEHPQTAALVLTKLSSTATANVLLAMPKQLRGEVAKRMVTMGNVKPGALRIVENQVRATLLGDSAKKSSSEGQARVATVLNELEKAQLDEILSDMETAGSQDVHAIRAQLFSFEDLPLLSQKARLMLFDGLSTEIVTLALRNASKELTEVVLSALGVRSRRMIEAELAMELDGLPAAEIAKARRAIAATAIRLSKDGKIELPSTQAAA